MPTELPSERGNAALLAGQSFAFFCSQSCPGDVILRAQDWANARDSQSSPVIGGFHTPVERDVLRILLLGGAPVTIVLARAAKGWRPPSLLGTTIREAIAAGLAKIVSPFAETHRRTTAASAETRNLHILTLAPTILIAHASPSGKTEALARAAIERGVAVQTFASAHNANLIELGATVLA